LDQHGKWTEGSLDVALKHVAQLRSLRAITMLNFPRVQNDGQYSTDEEEDNWGDVNESIVLQVLDDFATSVFVKLNVDGSSSSFSTLPRLHFGTHPLCDLWIKDQDGDQIAQIDPLRYNPAEINDGTGFRALHARRV
jgi:hypothetical protein